MKKLLLVFGAVSLIFFGNANAANITVYYSPSCPHCRHFHEFIEHDLIYEYPKLLVSEVNVMKEENLPLFREVLSKCKYNTGGVPVIVIGDKCFQGYADFMEKDVRSAIEVDLSDVDKKIAADNKKALHKDPKSFMAKNSGRINAISEYNSAISQVKAKKK